MTPTTILVGQIIIVSAVILAENSVSAFIILSLNATWPQSADSLSFCRAR